MSVLSNLWQSHSEWVPKELLWSVTETLQQQPQQQQQQSPKTQEILNMVGPPGFNSYIVNELLQDVENLDILVKTGINTPVINIP